jgi:hypothetical protein
MGRADEEVRDRTGADVVAAESRAGVPPQVSTDDDRWAAEIEPTKFLLTICTRATNAFIRALHEKEQGRGMTRGKFFLIALICSLAWYTVPGYIFPTITAVSWVCWVFPRSVTMQQIGSGLNGLGVGAFTLDWSVVAAFLGSPLVSPFFAIVNVYVGFVLLVYIIVPACYWALDLYDAGTFPIYSTDLFTGAGQLYNITAIVNDKFEIDMGAYAQQGKIHLSLFFAISYGLGFASIAATLSHVALFYGKYVCPMASPYPDRSVPARHGSSDCSVCAGRYTRGSVSRIMASRTCTRG